MRCKILKLWLNIKSKATILFPSLVEKWENMLMGIRY